MGSPKLIVGWLDCAAPVVETGSPKLKVGTFLEGFCCNWLPSCGGFVVWADWFRLKLKA